MEAMAFPGTPARKLLRGGSAAIAQAVADGGAVLGFAVDGAGAGDFLSGLWRAVKAKAAEFAAYVATLLARGARHEGRRAPRAGDPVGDARAVAARRRHRTAPGGAGRARAALPRALLLRSPAAPDDDGGPWPRRRAHAARRVRRRSSQLLPRPPRPEAPRVLASARTCPHVPSRVYPCVR
uniref:Uncharacterized protein n=1 Tax=Arundo donax TaxID=35708 RepID=A0A0A8XQI0_ARUDO